MSNKEKFDINKLVKLSIIFSVFIISLSIAFYFVIYLPSKDKARERQLQENRELLDRCLNQKQERYEKAWANSCKELGKDNNCDLPTIISDGLDLMFRNDSEECYRRYPIR